MTSEQLSQREDVKKIIKNNKTNKAILLDCGAFGTLCLFFFAHILVRKNESKFPSNKKRDRSGGKRSKIGFEMKELGPVGQGCIIFFL
jgi:hypothetical protein